MLEQDEGVADAVLVTGLDESLLQGKALSVGNAVRTGGG